MLNSITTWNSSHTPIPHSNGSRLSKKSQRLTPLHTFTTPFMKQDNPKITEAKGEFLWQMGCYTSNSPLPPREWELIIGTQNGKSNINLGTSSGKILLNDHWRILYKGLEWSESHETQGSFKLSSFSPCYMKPLPGYHHLRMA
jgi:hypothetical protein